MVKNEVKYEYGLWFNGYHSTDFYLDVISKEISMPDKDKNVVPIPLTSEQYDFYDFYNVQPFKQREIKVVFQIQNWQYEDKDMLYIKWTSAVNWLMKGGGLSTLVDDYMPQYQYRAEVQKGPDFEEARVKGTLTVIFTAYPFRRDAVQEGLDIWDIFNFELDVAQQTSFAVDNNIVYRDPNSFSYKPLQIGDKATYTAWASHYVNDIDETGAQISPSLRGFSDTIVAKRQIEVWNRSRWAYKMKSNGLWLREQDIVEAYTEYTDAILVNGGVSEVVPKIILKPLIANMNGDMTVIKNGQIFNLKAGTFETEAFTLQPGENYLRMFTRDGSKIEFEFHKELI